MLKDLNLRNSGLSIRICMDPHSFSLLDPDPGGQCGRCRAVDPHLFYADLDPAVFLNADPDPDPDPGPA